MDYPGYPTHCSLCGEPLDEHTATACREATRRELVQLRADLDAAQADNTRLRETLERLLRKPDNSITMTSAEYDELTAEK